MAFQRLELVRKGRLSQKQACRGLRQAAALRQRQQGLEMPNSKAVDDMSRFHPLYEDNEFES